MARHGERVPEVLWAASITMLRDAITESQRDDWGRFRAMPRRHLRVLRRDLAAGLELARMAAAMQEDENERFRELTSGLREAQDAAERHERRYASRQAVKVKALRARCRDEGRDPSWDEVYEAQAEAARELGMSGDDDLVAELHAAARRAAGQ